MIEVHGDIFAEDCDALCITTNGFVKANGWAVMGRGVALQATRRWPDIAQTLGRSIRENGNHVDVLHVEDSKCILSFPVKHIWMERADITLIRRSARELWNLANQHPYWQRIVLPRPGCGNGQLDWADVFPSLQDILLDGRFYIVDNGSGA